jgi:Domain of unknown function (DUF4331)
MSHHYSGPDFRFPNGDARLDFTDLYAFPTPGNTGKSVLIMNVHPSAGEHPPGPTTTEPFAPEALYELKVDTDAAEAKRVAATLLPDVLPYDPTLTASSPDSGWTLTDDGFDVFMRVLANGRATGDHVGPHGDLLLEFPYVGPPHPSRVTKAPNETTGTQDHQRDPN